MEKLLAKAPTKLDNANKIRPPIIIGFRPYLSENLPAIGENKNCVNPKADTKYPAALPLAPNSISSCGRIGMTRPAPSIARNI